MPLTAGDVQLANAALALLGEAAITSFSDPPDLAGKVATIYEGTVRAQLASYPWRFTLRKARLSRLSDDPVNEWTYQHQLPTDMLALRALRNAGGAGGATITAYEVFEQRVLSDHLDVWADYQVAVAPEYFPPIFHNLVRHALASDLAITVTGSASLAELHAVKAFGTAMERGGGGLTAAARRVDAQQQPPQRFTRFALIDARMGGAR